METLLAALATLLGSAVVGLSAYLVARRRNSGRVDTSDAATIWEESTKMRQELRDEVAGLRVDLAASNAKLDTAILRITELLHQVEVSQAATDAARKESELSRAETVRLQGSIDAVHQEVRTGNALTLGALADNAESRRVAEIPEADRTDAEREHIDTVGITARTPGGNPG